MHQARGPQAAILPFAPVVARSVPFRIAGDRYVIHGPTLTPPPPGTQLSIPANDGRMYHLVELVEPDSRD